jgi:hypothetical protein
MINRRMPNDANVETCNVQCHQANHEGNEKLKKLDQNERNYFYLKKQFEMFSSKKHELTIDEVEEEKVDPPAAASPPPLLLKNQQIYSITYQTNLILNQCECKVNKTPLRTHPKNPHTHKQASNIAVISSNSSQRKDWHVAKIFILVKTKK